MGYRNEVKTDTGNIDLNKEAKSDTSNVLSLNKEAESDTENVVGLNEESESGVSNKVDLKGGNKGPNLNLNAKTYKNAVHHIDYDIRNIGSGNQVLKVQVGISLTSESVVNDGNWKQEINLTAESEISNNSIVDMMEELEMYNEVNYRNKAVNRNVIESKVWNGVNISGSISDVLSRGDALLNLWRQRRSGKSTEFMSGSVGSSSSNHSIIRRGKGKGRGRGIGMDSDSRKVMNSVGESGRESPLELMMDLLYIRKVQEEEGIGLIMRGKGWKLTF